MFWFKSLALLYGEVSIILGFLSSFFLADDLPGTWIYDSFIPQISETMVSSQRCWRAEDRMHLAHCKKWWKKTSFGFHVCASPVPLPCSFWSWSAFLASSATESKARHLSWPPFSGTEHKRCENGEEVCSASVQVSHHPAAGSWSWRGEDPNPCLAFSLDLA